ncbi:L-histidine N(alpha)-methyltransferase [Streptomyces sp. NPDC060031]|uniref:L-histidine N(alpha)-methyltransferase n=1 Tax=Streptomyces sp. NPDC060031 TaxID=3347043 RepID=UPI00367CF930
MSDFLLTRTLDEHAAETALRHDVLTGLARSPKVLPPKWFYDTRGSELFEQITRLPEYYPTRAEREILLERAREIASVSGARTLVELGSGSSEKTRHLIEAMPALDTYVPVDVSESALKGAAQTLLAAHSGLRVHALLADFTKPLRLPDSPGPRLVVFLGGTVGNLLPPERAVFLADVRAMLAPGDALLMGTDLVKDEAVLVAAYDDAQGVTAEFNKNVLTVINRELGADFHTADFAHVAVWNREQEWIEMRLRARSELLVKVRELDLEVPFAVGEEILTEVSAKFRQAGVRKELASAGLELTHWWTDAAGRFALSLSVANGVGTDGREGTPDSIGRSAPPHTAA